MMKEVILFSPPLFAAPVSVLTSVLGILMDGSEIGGTDC
jgi:hypothetical protein